MQRSRQRFRATCRHHQRHLLYINEDAFDISQRAWEFMSVHGTSVSDVPVAAPWLLGGALASAGALALLVRRR